ncbi:uncharacterized protein TNCT_469471 [Trichonephila clavata]|uniref:Uncharacterized protein n=1 Tax=Trichonephila clavata TaxID=2740835 RepID=A0A8X6J5A1_TRICU|nr:uncharacterized protein TNCT_469471 [Trichonephila clavata]
MNDPAFSNSIWEIFTPEKNSLYWSIVVSYLIPVAHARNSVEFDRRLRNLIGDKKESGRIMQSASLRFNQSLVEERLFRLNPFKKTHTFTDENLVSLFRIFKKRLNRNTKNRSSGSVENLKLEATSKMLNCFIRVYKIDPSGTKEFNLYPRGSMTSSENGSNTITIFYHTDSKLKNREKDTFGFGMSVEIANILREKALTFILKKDKFLKRDSHSIKQVVGSDRNLPISLLNSDIKHVIPRIYKSPYILGKLINAGYIMNPLALGRDGFSAFYYCIGLSDSQFFNILYSYAANNFQRSEESCRKPSDEILQSLKHLMNTIGADYVKSIEFSSLGDIALRRYSEMLRFNQYQENVVKILKDSQQSGTNDVALAIFKEYSAFYFWNNLPDDECIQFNDYLDFSDYYENLDSFTCIVFFDNPSIDFKTLVEPFLLTLLSNKYFPKKDHIHISGSSFPCNQCSGRIIPFKHRMNLHQVLQNLLNNVQNVSTTNIGASADIIRNSIREIPKDEFLIEKLKTYLELAVNVQLEHFDEDGNRLKKENKKEVLTIFRTLQVFGEVLQTSLLNFTSGFLLKAHLPSDLKKTFTEIRNRLSHYFAKCTQGRLNLENKVDELKGIQDELKSIYEFLEPVFVSQQFRMKEFLIRSQMERFPNLIVELERITTERRNWYETHLQGYKLFANNVISFFKKHWQLPIPDKKDNAKFKDKINLFKAGIQSINTVFCFNISLPQHLLTTSQKLTDCITILESTDQSTVDMNNIFFEYEEVLKQICNYKEIDPNQPELKCPGLKRFEIAMREHNIFSNSENLKIRNHISQLLIPSFEATKKLEEALTNNQSLPDLDQVLNQTFLSAAKRKQIKKDFGSNPDNCLNLLKKFSYSTIEQALGVENDTTVALLDMFTQDGYKIFLLNAPFQEKSIQTKMLKLMNQKVEFLIDRIKQIKNILIDEDDETRGLTEYGRSEEVKKHIKFLMCQRYMMEMDVRVSLDQLLFDCLNILNRKDLDDIYRKTSNMFAGVNLRDILSHGNIVIETIGSLLDPDDLPSELIFKMLELIKDENIIKRLAELWMKNKPQTRKDLHDIIDQDSNSSFIKECSRWESYAIILPIIDRNI